MAIETIYLCPSTPAGNCLWEGKQNEVLPHFEKDHPDFFLNVNYIDLDLSVANKTSYLMHLSGETYLVQIQYSTETEEVEIKLRYLGPLKKATTISYFINIECGNFAFTSKSNADEYHVITRRDGAIIIEANTIRAICGRKILENVRAYVNIEGENNSFITRAIRRSFHTSKSLEVKVRQVFQRNASYRSSIRKRSMDSMEFVEAIRRKSVQLEEGPPSDFVNQILDDIIDDVVEKCHNDDEPGDIQHPHVFTEQTISCDQIQIVEGKQNDAVDTDDTDEYKLVGEAKIEEETKIDQETKIDSHLEDKEVDKIEEEPSGNKEFREIMNDFDDTVELRVAPKFIKPHNSIFGSVSDFFQNSFFQKLDSQLDLTSTSLFERKESFFGFRESYRETKTKTKRERTISVEHIIPMEIGTRDEEPTQEAVTKDVIDGVDGMKDIKSDVESDIKPDVKNDIIQDAMPDVVPRRKSDTEPTDTVNRLSLEKEYYDKINSIKCKSCSIIMIPPIFMCLNGHSICLNCKPTVCQCKAEVTDLRNCDLEEISRSVAHPCRFAQKGCTEVRSCYEIRYHEIKCDYFNYKCPQCPITGKYYDIISHVKLLHHSLRIVEALVNPFPRNSEFLVMHQAGLFFCTALVFGDSIEWSVTFCGAEKISFSCVVAVKSKKVEKKFPLRKNGNLCKVMIFLNELKNNRLKDKHAMLYIEVSRPEIH